MATTSKKTTKKQTINAEVKTGTAATKTKKSVIEKTSTATKKATTTAKTTKTTAKDKKTSKIEKRRLIVSYERLSDKEKDLFEEIYADNLMDHIKAVNRPDGTPMFVVPLETEDSIYMVKIDLRVDTKISDDDFDKEIDKETKSSEDDIESLISSNGTKGRNAFQLNHGDYSSINSIEEAVAKEDMDKAEFTSLDDIDVADENSIDL